MSAQDDSTARPGMSDTSSKAQEVLIELYRRMPGWRKMQQVTELTQTVNQLALMDIRWRHPQASDLLQPTK